MPKAHFYIYETADLPIVLSKPEVLEGYEKIVVSISQINQVKLHISDGLGVDTEQGIINVHLTQEDTAKFKVGTATVQINIKYENSDRDVSAQAEISVLDNLYKEVM